MGELLDLRSDSPALIFRSIANTGRTGLSST